jgi:hypothetical protein
VKIVRHCNRPGHDGTGHECPRAQLGRGRPGGARAARFGDARRQWLGLGCPWDPSQERRWGYRGRTGPHPVARSAEQLPHRAAARSQLGRDLLVAAALHLPQHERAALAVRERLHGRQDISQSLAPLEGLVGRLYTVGVFVELLDHPAAVPQPIDSQVVRNPVQPGTQAQVAVIALHSPKRVNERLLHDVLGAPIGQYTRYIANKAPPVAVHDDLERSVVSGPHEIDEPLVRLRSQQRTTGEPCRCDKGFGCHGATDPGSDRRPLPGRRALWGYVQGGAAVRPRDA